MPGAPVLARLDGKAFHSFTRGMERPYDQRLVDSFIDTTYALVDQSNALIGYTQSDQISLLFYSADYKSQIFFDGKLQKMVSVLASMCTAFFNQVFKEYFSGEGYEKTALFDCRCQQVPDKTEAANYFLWREKDATRNSIQSATQAVYPHSQVMGKNQKAMQEMLHEKGINWNDYPGFFKRGTFIQKRTENIKFSAAELKRLPEKHEAKQNPDLLVERKVIKTLNTLPFGGVTNKENVLFEGADPKRRGKND